MDLNGFDESDQQALIPNLPSSSVDSKVVRLGAKVLETKKDVRKVLDEEHYVTNMQKIIVRDYFPELPKLRAQAEYMDAVASNDQAKIRELQVRYSTKRTDRRTSPSARPKSPRAWSSKTFDSTTPGPSASAPDATDLPFSNLEGDNESVAKKKKKLIDSLTLQKYMDSFTSEDNASFEELALMHSRRERIKNSWMYEAEERHNEELIFRDAQDRALLPADEQAVALLDKKKERPTEVDGWHYKARNQVLFFPDDAPVTVEEHMRRTKQNEKIINKEATRLNEKMIQQPHQAQRHFVAMHQAVVNSGLVDISGKDLGVVSATTLGCVATPTPMPGIEDSPLMTWGEIEGTPFRLDGSDIAPPVADDAPAFKIPEVPLRERIAKDIADTIAQRYRDKRKYAMATVEKMHAKTPKFGSMRNSELFSVLSPAAKRLATNKLGIRIGTEKMLKDSYMKSPRSARSTVYSPAIRKSVKIKSEIKVEPQSNPSSASTTPQRSVTDNLLHLPSPTAPSTVDPSSRPSASDFF